MDRRYKHLDFEERGVIFAEHRRGSSLRQIGLLLGRHASTIGRELERVARDDMATLYTTAAVLLFPSHYEGFGLPVLEAQMCGTPVVCSDRGALPEVGKQCTFPSDAASSFVNKCVEMITPSSLDIATKALPQISLFGSESWKHAHQKIYKI